MALSVQATLLLIGLLAFAAYPYARHLASIERGFLALARRKRLVILLAGLLPILICAGLALRLGFPVPKVQDEFSYLLAADTFAHGRLTNPPHPMWEHFESQHIIFNPSYQSKYPPGQGLFRAAGEVLAGQPIIGVWICLGLAMAAMAWMLHSWMPSRWILPTLVITLANGWIIQRWGFEYWGNAAALLGGALYLGGLRRWVVRPRAGAGMVAALGVSLLANSRPYEGLIFTVVAFVLLGPALGPRRRVRQWFALWPKVLPAVAVLAANFAWMGYYNYRVTGDPLTMPYQVWSRQSFGMSVAASAFDFASPSAERVRTVYRDREKLNMDTRDPTDVFQKLDVFGSFFIGVFLGLPLIAAFTVGRHRVLWRAIATTGVVTLAVVLENTQGHPHYLAPAACVLALITAKGLERLWRARPFGVIEGRRLVLGLLAACGAALAVLVLTWPGAPGGERARILNELEARGGRHVVIVHYGPDHPFSDEWVYNEADIDAAQVIWARDLGKRNAELFAYYPDRTVWNVDADAEPAVLTLVRKPDPEQAAR